MRRRWSRWPRAAPGRARSSKGPFGFDNAISAEAARIKSIGSRSVAGDADLLLMPDLNAGNMLYKSFNYIGGGDCAGLVLGTRVPVVLTSRADSLPWRASPRSRWRCWLRRRPTERRRRLHGNAGRPDAAPASS